MRLSLKIKTINRLKLTHHPRYHSNLTNKSRSFKKPKSFLSRLLEKQRLRYHHGLTNKQLSRYTTKIRQSPGPAGLSLLCELAMRLDSVLFQMGFTDSIRSARQLIRHGHIFVNGRVNSMPGYRCQVNDLIVVTPKLKIRQLVNRHLLQNRRLTNPGRGTSNTLALSYALACVKNQKILIQRDIKPRELKFKVNHMLVMEYFS